MTALNRVPMLLIRSAVALTLSLTIAPLAAEAQPAGRVARVGVLLPTAPAPATETPALGITRELRLRLHELGWVEGGSLVFEARFANNRPDRLRGLAADLVALNMDVNRWRSWGKESLDPFPAPTYSRGHSIDRMSVGRPGTRD
jgi:hypothetical protein